MKIRLYILFVWWCLLVPCCAQTQQGIVKTIGRPNKPGMALKGVTIRMKGMVNAVVSSATGEFHLSAPGKKDGDEIILLGIHKKGYELKDKELLGRQLVFSTRVPLEILMVDQQQLALDKQRIESNAYRVAEQNYQKTLKELDRKKQENEITVERYRQELQQLQRKYENYLSLISDMADRYARTDYDQLDSLDRRINLCIENGELDKADSLIHAIFNPETVLERNRAAKEEIRQRIEFAQSIIDKANADKEAILRDTEYAKRVVALSHHLANEYLLQGELAKAVECMNKALEMERIIFGEDSKEVEKTIQQIDSLK